ncbi:MAG: NrfD/PsrC family molybdoenzyme membrane anchor subunit [Nitrospirota bacterium]
MEMNVLYNVPHEFALSPVISTYFYLLGIGGGCSLLSVWATLTGKVNYKPIAKIGGVFVILLFSGAPVLLIVDLGQPLRFWYFLTLFNFTSPLTWGSVLLCLYPIVAGCYVVCMFLGLKVYKILAVFLLPVAIGYVAYIGFAVALGLATSSWNTPIMPAYFISAAMVSGIALMTMVGIIRHKLLAKFWDPEKAKADFAILIKLTQFAALFLLLDLFFIFTQQVYMRFGSEWSVLAARYLLEGKMWMNFGLFSLVLGTIVPLLVIAIPKVNRSLGILFTAMLLAEIGIFVMRFSITTGSQYLPIM